MMSCFLKMIKRIEEDSYYKQIGQQCFDNCCSHDDWIFQERKDAFLISSILTLLFATLYCLDPFS